MKVYFDVIWLMNFALDFLLIWLSASLLRLQLRTGRALLAAAVGGLYAVMIFFPALSWLYAHFVKFMFAAAMVWIAFGYSNLVSFIRCLATFYLVSFITGGGIFAIHYFFLTSVEVVSGVLVAETGGMNLQVFGIIVLIGFGLMLVFARGTFRSVEKRQQLTDWFADVHIVLLGHSVSCRGLIDTGNQLSDPLTRTPVIVVESSLLSDCLPSFMMDQFNSADLDGFYSNLTSIDQDGEWQQRLRLVPYRGVGKDMQFMVALRPDRVVIAGQDGIRQVERVLIGLDGGSLSKDGDYRAILHPTLLLQQTS